MCGCICGPFNRCTVENICVSVFSLLQCEKWSIYTWYVFELVLVCLLAVCNVENMLVHGAVCVWNVLYEMFFACVYMFVWHMCVACMTWHGLVFASL